MGWGLRREGFDLDMGREDVEGSLYVIELELNDFVDEEFEFEFWFLIKEDCVVVIFFDYGFEVGWIFFRVWLVVWIGIEEKGFFFFRRIFLFLIIWLVRNGYFDFFKILRNLR